MRRQRGNIVAFLMVAVTLGGAAGYGAYRLIREHRLASERADAEAKARQPAPAPAAPERPVLAMEGAPPHAGEGEPASDATEAADRAVEAAASRATPPAVPDQVDRDTLVFGSAGIVGMANSVGIDRTVRKVAPRLTRCMRKAREAGQRDSRSFDVTFEIGVDGTVTTASVPGTSDSDAPLAPCVLDVFRALRFERPTDGKPATVVFPLAFVAPTPCDEVSCVLANYEGACCQKFRKRP